MKRYTTNKQHLISFCKRNLFRTAHVSYFKDARKVKSNDIMLKLLFIVKITFFVIATKRSTNNYSCILLILLFQLQNLACIGFHIPTTEIIIERPFQLFSTIQ